jgi:hypothetical protein
LIFDLVKDIERELEANVTGNMIPFSRYGINVFKQYDCQSTCSRYPMQDFA